MSRPDEHPILEIVDVSFGFGGVAALSGVDLVVRRGECVGLIGPNGAGKSTLLNCVSQLTSVHSGAIRVNGRDCAGLHPADLVDLGVKRTFQNIETFAEMRVREILAVGAHRLARTSVTRTVFGSPAVARADERVRVEIARTAESLGLTDVLDAPIAGLPYGTRKLVDLARALVGGAELLLLDEPAAGLSDWEWRELLTVLNGLKSAGTMGILVVEHQLGFVRALADRLYALDAGRVVAQGDPAEVLADRRVVEAYLGPGVA